MPQNDFVSKTDLKREFGNFERKIDSRFETFEQKMDRKIEDAVGQIVSAVAKGFEETASKKDLEKVQTDLEEVKKDVRVIKKDVSDLKADTITQKQFKDHDQRITRLEKIRRSYLQEELSA